MSVSLYTAKWLAPTAFLVDFAAQTYGMLSSPNMKDVHDAHISFFSPQPFFIAGFFGPQQLLQVAWLYRLLKTDDRDVATKSDTKLMVDYVPYYALGNFCIATWMIFWNRSQLQVSNIFVLVNSLAQLYFVLGRLPTMNTSSRDSVLTHIVAKTFAGIGVLDLLHNGASAYMGNQAPSTAVQALTGVGFGLLATASDWIFGGCLVYDLVALMVGQKIYGNAGWSNMLGIYAAGVGAIVAAKNLLL